MRLTVDPMQQYVLLSGSLVSSLGFASPEPAASLQCWLLFAALETMSGQLELLRRAAGSGDCRTRASDQCTAEEPASWWR